jgi:hypothetical protein
VEVTMLLHVHRVALAAVLIHSVFVGSAAAECAWVLWKDAFLGVAPVRPLRTWTADGAWPGEAECRDKMRERIQLAQPPSEQLRQYELTFKTIVSEDQYTTVGEDETGQRRLLITVQFLCLPDTIDPRGPKAK